MKPDANSPKDPLIDTVRETRERLVQEHGGLRGWAQYLQELQKRHPARVLPPRVPVIQPK